MWDWTRRISFPADRSVSLDWGAELWKWDTTLYDSVPAITEVLRRNGRDFDDDSVLADVTSTLIFDVVDAAGGVEGAFVRLEASLAEAQAILGRLSSTNRETDGAHLGGASVEDAWYALEEMLTWARTLDDRLQRESLKKREGYRNQGLVPALAEGQLRGAAVNARARLRQSAFGEARFLAGLNLHMQSSQSGTKLGLVREGRVVLRFPDRVTQAVSHRFQLTYRDGRDGEAFARTLMAAVERFMEDLIQALTMYGPERFKQPQPAPLA